MIDYSVPAPTLAIAATDASKAEGNAGSTAFTFTVTRSGDTSGVSTVSYAVTGSGTSAANAADFTGGMLPGGSVTFNATETSKVITVNVNGDTTVESNDGFTVTLSSPVGATVSTAPATGTITYDDDQGVAPTISISDVTLAEGNDGTTTFTFTVTLNSAAGGPVNVDFATANGTASAAGDDDDGDDEDDDKLASTAGNYAAQSGSLHFAGTAGETQTITVSIRGDTEVEPDESFFLNLTNASGATIADSQGVGTILNDEPPASGVFLRDGVLQVIGTEQKDSVSVRMVGTREFSVSGSLVKNSKGQRFKVAEGPQIRPADTQCGEPSRRATPPPYASAGRCPS